MEHGAGSCIPFQPNRTVFPLPSLPFFSVVETEATLVSGFFLGPVSLLVVVPAVVVVQLSGDRVESFLALDEV